MMKNVSKKKAVLIMVLVVSALIICIASAIVFIILTNNSLEQSDPSDDSSIETIESSIKENVSVATNSEASIDPEELPLPENPSTVDEFFWNYSRVYKVIDVHESKDVKTEKEAVAFFSERGFTQFPIQFDFSMDGEYMGDTEASDSSSATHPRYFTFFQSDNGDIYKLFLINDMIIAYPVSFMLEGDHSVDVLISESNKVTSYNSEVNRFYLNTPFSSSAIIKQIARIDDVSINALSREELAK